MTTHRNTGPRVRTISKSRNAFEGRYKDHKIYLSRLGPQQAWHIQVRSPDGTYLYDGWWTKPQHEGRTATLREAIAEACRGSLLWREQAVP